MHVNLCKVCLTPYSLRFKAARLTDKRVKVMNEVITGIRVIKMYAWEYAFKDLVDGIRKYEALSIVIIYCYCFIYRNEIYIIFKALLINTVNMVNYKVSLPLIMFVVFSAYVNTSDTQLTPRKVFVTLTLINFARLSIYFFFLGTLLLSTIRVSWKRITV